MNNEQKQPLTAEQYADRNYIKFKGENYVTVSDFISCMEEYAAQQTDALREELEMMKKIVEVQLIERVHRVREIDEFRKRISELHGSMTKMRSKARMADKLAQELESCKKELAEVKRNKWSREEVEDIVKKVLSGIGSERNCIKDTLKDDTLIFTNVYKWIKENLKK